MAVSDVDHEAPYRLHQTRVEAHTDRTPKCKVELRHNNIVFGCCKGSNLTKGDLFLIHRLPSRENSSGLSKPTAVYRALSC